MSLAAPGTDIGAITPASLESVVAFQNALLEFPQVEMPVRNVLHGGMYARTIKVPAGVIGVGVYIQVPTILIVSGDVTIYANEQAMRVTGYQVLAASAHRKQVFHAHQDTEVTMLLASNATSVEQAENEFTNEPQMLVSRGHEHINSSIITQGERPCLESQ